MTGKYKRRASNSGGDAVSSRSRALAAANDKWWSALSVTQLKNLAEHKYSATGTSLLEPYFQPFWCWLVEQMPLSLAPNLITIIGLVLNVLTSTIVILKSPNGSDDVCVTFIAH